MKYLTEHTKIPISLLIRILLTHVLHLIQLPSSWNIWIYNLEKITE